MRRGWTWEATMLTLKGVAHIGLFVPTDCSLGGFGIRGLATTPSPLQLEVGPPWARPYGERCLSLAA